MSIESIRARLRRHDRQRMRYGYSDETAPQIWERDLRALLKVAEAARALEGYKQLYADTLDCLEDKCAELAALRAENERLRDALVIVDEQESRPDFAQWLSVRSVVRHALAALEGRD